MSCQPILSILLLAAITQFILPANAAGQEPIIPIQPARVSNPAMVELGKQLFFDPRLSRSGFISCNSCHNLSMGGTDNLKSSIGHNWQQGPINSPTVLNAKFNAARSPIPRRWRFRMRWRWKYCSPFRAMSPRSSKPLATTGWAWTK